MFSPLDHTPRVRPDLEDGDTSILGIVVIVILVAFNFGGCLLLVAG